MSNDGSTLLKILTGPHQGAEMELGPGSYVIGRADDCDIILSDVMVEPKQIQLDWRAGRGVVRRLAGDVYIDGKLMASAEKEIKPFQYVTVGSTYFTLGPSTEAWPPNALKPLPSLEQPKKQTPPVAALNISRGQGPIRAPQEEAAGATGGVRRLFHPSLLLTIMALAFAGAGAMLQWQQTPQVVAAPPPPTIDQVQMEVNAAIGKLPFTSDVRTSIEDPELVVEGSVSHNDDLRLLKNALAPWQSRITFSVISNEQLLGDAREILSALNSDLNADLSDGQIVVSGYVGSAKQLQELRSILVQDLPGNFRLTFTVLTNESAAETATQIVNQSGLGDAIVVTPSSTGIVASGKIDSNMEPLWNRVRQEIGKSLPMLPNVENSVTVEAQDAETKDDNSIDSICLGPIPWFRLHNGQTCFNGASLTGGWTVTSILADSVEVSKGGEVRAIKLGSAVTPGISANLTPSSDISNTTAPFSIR